MTDHSPNDSTSSAVSAPGPAEKDAPTTTPDAVYLARYSEHNARLQTWIGGYGAGLASLLVYQFRTAIGDTRSIWQAKGPKAEPALNVVLGDMHSDLSVALRLVAVGLALQIGLLTLNKYTQLTQAHTSKDERSWSWWENFSVWCGGQSWIDLFCDLASVGLLAAATAYGLEALGITP